MSTPRGASRWLIFAKYPVLGGAAIGFRPRKQVTSPSGCRGIICAKASCFAIEVLDLRLLAEGGRDDFKEGSSTVIQRLATGANGALDSKLG
jgi:hypothetical protein